MNGIDTDMFLRSAETKTTSKSSSPTPSASSIPKNVNVTMMASSFLGGTSAASDVYYASEAWVFYQDVNNVRLNPSWQPWLLGTDNTIRTFVRFTAKD